jgi:hypothetical protein
MNDRDPLDDLLRSAFAADRARTSPVEIAGRVMARIRWLQRLRVLTLTAALLVGLAALAVSVEPALTALGGIIDQRIATVAEWQSSTLALMLLAVVGAGWLMVMDWEWS